MILLRGHDSPQTFATDAAFIKEDVPHRTPAHCGLLLPLPPPQFVQETAKMLAETGMALAKDKLSVQGGFHTPASALGDTLVARLKRRNLIIEVEE